MAKLTGLVDTLRAQQGASALYIRCPVFRLMEILDDDDRAELQSALSSEIYAGVISRFIEETFPNMRCGKDAIKRHRQGICGCARAGRGQVELDVNVRGNRCG